MNIVNKIRNFLFLAFASGNSDNKSDIKRYTGIGSASVLAVNPNREQFNKIFPNSKNTDEISYIGTRDIDGKTVQTARVCFIIKLDPRFNNGISAIFPIYFNLEKRSRVTRDGLKVQVIDEYGQTCWVTEDELKTHAIPIYSNGPAQISTNYRVVYRGEEALVKFLRAFLCIEDIRIYDNDAKTWITNPNPDKCKSMLEKIPDYFNGDFSEIIELINLQPDNKVKILFGVRHSDDNKDYQDFFNGHFMRNRQVSTIKMQSELDNAKNNGSYANSDFFVGSIKEYAGPEPTKFEDTTDIFADPFAPGSKDSDDGVDDLPFGF